MKLVLTSVAVLAALSLASCRPKEQAPQATSTQAPRPQSANVGAHTGLVQEVIQGSSYTYLNVMEGDDGFWIATSKSDVDVGETVSFADALEMKDFTSKELQRTFETIYFVSAVNRGPLPVAADGSAATSGHAKPAVEQLEVSIEPAAGGIRIGELFANRDSYADETVRIRGQVSKVNRAIMGKNWVHLQDGTGDAGHFDLTITTAEEVAPGDVVTFEGTIVLNKDFGAGYAYEVLMEEARLLDE